MKLGMLPPRIRNHGAALSLSALLWLAMGLSGPPVLAGSGASSSAAPLNSHASQVVSGVRTCITTASGEWQNVLTP